MRTLAAGLFMSLDGVVESPGTWSGPYFTDEMAEGIAEGIKGADAVLMGTGTYRIFAEMWPAQGDSNPMAAFLNRTPKYVVSSTLDTVDWENSVLLKGDLVDAVTELKARDGGDIRVPGSPRLVRSLLAAGLLDRLDLTVCPVVVGGGLRLFDDVPAGTRLELVASTASASGAVGLTYR